MKKNILITGLSLLSFIGAFSSVDAHVYWVEPNEFYFYNEAKAPDKKVSENLTFEFTGSDTFFNADSNRAKDDESSYRFRIINKDGKEVPIKNSWQGKTRAVFETEINTAGTYALEETRIGKPMYYTELKNGEYVYKAANELTKEELAQKDKSIGYYQYTKSYSTIHSPDDAWRQILGQRLEIVPLSHPNKLYVGDSLKIQLLYEGKPLASAKIDLVTQNYRTQKHDSALQSVTTDKDGIAEFKFKNQNRYLLFTKYTISLENDKHAEVLDFRSSLMLQVNEQWVKGLE